VQHTNPQRFRAIPLGEAVRTLREQYEHRIERLHETLQALEIDASDRNAETPEVWTVSAEQSLDARIVESILGADDEVVLVIGADRGWTPELENAVQTAADRGVEVVVVTVPSVSVDVDHLDVAECFESELSWLETPGDVGEICRLLLVDRETLLLTSLADRRDEDGEHGIVAEGATNGAVVLCSRMLLDELPHSTLAS
jgi:sugar-specific transcriptional regulator TrmB